MAWAAANTVARTMNGYRQVYPHRLQHEKPGPFSNPTAVRRGGNAGFVRVGQSGRLQHERPGGRFSNPTAVQRVGNGGFVRVRPPVHTGGFVQVHVPVHALGHGFSLHPRSIPNYTVASPQAVPDMSGIDAFISNLLNQRYRPAVEPVPDMSGVDAYLAQLLASRHPYAGAQPV